MSSTDQLLKIILREFLRQKKISERRGTAKINILINSNNSRVYIAMIPSHLVKNKWRNKIIKEIEWEIE